MVTMNKGGQSSSSNRTFHLSSIGLAIQAFYINLTIDQVNGSEQFHIKPIGPPMYSPSYHGSYVDAGDIGKFAFDTLSHFVDKGGNTGGFNQQTGYHDGLNKMNNGYDVGRTYGGAYNYGRGGKIGGQFGQQTGRNKGHVASGFATSYRKDERGDNSAYYDDGMGSGGQVIYAAHDSRFKDGGDDGYRGGYHDSSLFKKAKGNQGQYGHGVNYYGKGHHGGLGGYGQGYGYGSNYYNKGGKFLGAVKPAFGYGPLIKSSGTYVVPMPSKLYYD
ncbi:hypothetical protein LSTR_LSTR010747 [Laodelphax striatellus]|uniref:Uncharacterized protein n=1 Tax=Laodelphax striatellus TaxID=195883 RepID=A0A482XT38_LAOST|nr:hypothetical protein LSTR_LSTR010747 [Laodelphax striatellus]